MRFCTILFLILFLLTSGTAEAHGSGASFEEAVGEYKIDIGYEPSEIIEGDRVVFDFGLRDANTDKAVPFTRVWTRLEHEGKTMLATGIGKPETGPTTMLFEVPTPGDWTLQVRYERNGEAVVEKTFAFTVSDGEISYQPFFLPGLVGFGLGICAFGAVVMLMRRA